MSDQAMPGQFKLSLDQVNYLNIGLMLLSVALAFFVPFELFLLAYAVLGPLHYLTEISWLHDRNYFSPKKWDWIPLGILSLFITISFLYNDVEAFTKFLDANGMKSIGKFFDDWSNAFTFAAFGIALLLVIAKDKWARIFGGILILFVTLVFYSHSVEVVKGGSYLRDVWFKIFAVYLPTLIHVYVFTGIFILVGALKSRSNSGYLSLLVFVGCAIACLFFLPMTSYTVAEWARVNYEETFETLSTFMLFDVKNVRGTALRDLNIFTDPRSIMIARFIGFAYTYHYLNWFSKTSVIKWHEISRTRLAGVIALWIASVAFYFYNYQFGFKWLFFLSFAHVMLEFPLNHQSFITVGKEIGARFRGSGGQVSGAGKK